MSDLRSKLEKLLKEWENSVGMLRRDAELTIHPSHRARIEVRADAYAACATALRALLAEQQLQRVRIAGVVPEVAWVRYEEDSSLWCWELRYTDGARRGGTRWAPSPTHRPVLVDGVWWWEVQP